MDDISIVDGIIKQFITGGGHHLAAFGILIPIVLRLNRAVPQALLRPVPDPEERPPVSVVNIYYIQV